jgi:cytochrome b involved in lipid metabolism
MNKVFSVAIIVGAIGIALVTIPPLLTNNPQSQTTNKTVSKTLPTYTLSDIQLHHLSSNCWMAIGNQVYDVTKYIPSHPNNDIVKGCGQDATSMYQEVRKHLRGQAVDLLPEYIIGTLKS